MLWGILGSGIGALLRNQLGATITASLLYTVGYFLAGGIFAIIYNFWIKEDWVLTAQVIIPATAAQIFTSAVELYPQAPAVLGGGARAARLRRRDRRRRARSSCAGATCLAQLPRCAGVRHRPPAGRHAAAGVVTRRVSA